jgi:hypothetical protein
VSDEPSSREVAEAAAEVAAVAAAFEGGPAYYQSRERGTELVEGPTGLNPVHAERAAAAVRRGDRVADGKTLRALDRQANSDWHTHR